MFSKDSCSYLVVSGSFLIGEEMEVVADVVNERDIGKIADTQHGLQSDSNLVGNTWY